MRQSQSPDVWEFPAAMANLAEGGVYHYWFEVTDTCPYRNGATTPATLRCTDPAAWTVDWRLRSDVPANFTDDDRDPAGVVLYTHGELKLCDPDGQTPSMQSDAPMDTLPPNNRLVIYELPTAWTRSGQQADSTQVGVGCFRDVLALVDRQSTGVNFAGIGALGAGQAHLLDLGINALELLPPADTLNDRRSWGYATSNHFAPDFDLGRPQGADAPSAATDLTTLVQACHHAGIRFLYDAVMAFANHDSYRDINYMDFHVWWDHGDPEQDNRDGFGGDLFKYGYLTTSYDPMTDQGCQGISPGRQHMGAHIAHWMTQYHVDGLRLDSVVNIHNYGFVQQLRNEARNLWCQRWLAANHPGTGNERFITIGEAVPWDQRGCVDSLWNFTFRDIIRRVILGQNADGEPSFEWSVRKLIDCRNLGFGDGSQAVNFITCHDVGGFRNERLYNFLAQNGVILKDRQIKLAFACLLTAVGIPMILAGEEFADEHDLDVSHAQTGDANKQMDPVNFDRLSDPWRQQVFQYVSRLVKLRTQSDALAVNDTQFIHVDFEQGKRVLAWVRGRPGIDDLVVVVANFSDWGTDMRDPAAEYVVHNWPAASPGKDWFEVTQQRDVPAQWAGREPIYPWEAKVYQLRSRRR